MLITISPKKYPDHSISSKITGLTDLIHFRLNISRPERALADKKLNAFPNNTENYLSNFLSRFRAFGGVICPTNLTGSRFSDVYLNFYRSAKNFIEKQRLYRIQKLYRKQKIYRNAKLKCNDLLILNIKTKKVKKIALFTNF